MISVSTFLADAALALLFIGLIALGIYFDRRGKPTNVTLLPYQRGVLFRMGLPLRDVGPGNHRVWTGTELLVHGDTRPISVNFENQVVALQDGFAALYGFSASAQVQDMRKAIYSARDYTNVPAFVLLRCARRHLNLSSAASIKAGKDAIVTRIGEEAKTRLGAAGFSLVSFRLTQLAIGTTQAPAPQTTPRLSSSNG
jgi:regulator of protease activity HflC (stomatin/prohibitin superfamily)